ncbi:MAG: GNAT family N-acetyltransferase [Bacteroidota bacterium]|nr:GNAT family N-acetyltransferase [Bacteroidota bacterium]
MIKIDTLKGTDFLKIHQLAGEIDGIVQHPGHVYKIMADHFGDTFFIAREENEDNEIEILGFMMGFVSRKMKGELFVWQIAVSDNAQGKGIGSKLLQHTIDYAIKANDCNAVIATVETDNRPSQKLFEKFGFIIDSQKYRTGNQEMINVNNREAIKNYYGSGTDQIFYIKKV